MLHLKSICPAFIEIDKEYLLETQVQTIDTTKQNLVIKYYPLSSTIDGKISIPSIISVNSSKLKNTPNYIVTLYPNNHIEICLKPTLIPNNIYLNKSVQKIENSLSKLYIYKSKYTTFSIESEDDFFYFDYPQSLTYYKGIEIGNTFHLFFENSLKEIVYFVINNGNIKTYEDIKDFDFAKNKLTAIIPHHDMSGSGKAIEINFSKPFSYEEKTIYLSQKPKLITEPHLIPYAFIESIRSKNYKLAKHYMTKTMAEKLSEQMLYDFFGDIKSISYDPYNDKICTIYKDEQFYTAKNYDFEFVNGKISNINEL